MELGVFFFSIKMCLTSKCALNISFENKFGEKTFNSLLLKRFSKVLLFCSDVLNLFKIFSCLYIYIFVYLFLYSFIEFQSNDKTFKCFQAACNAFVSFCLTLTITSIATTFPQSFRNLSFLYNLSAKSIKSNFYLFCF